MRIHLLISTCAIALSWAGVALAQAGSTANSSGGGAGAPETTLPEARAPGTAASSGLSEIIVTAQRRTENLQKVAVAVDVVNPADLVQAGLTSSTQLGQLVPALSVQPNGGANTIFFLRGVGNFTINGYSDPAIAFNYDGVYVGRPTATSSYFFDVERIEVLKGPQGTVYGRNATAGAINVIPARPVLGQFAGNFSGSYGNYNAYDIQAALNVPLGDKFAARVATSIHGHDGYLSDGSSDDNGRSVRAQILGRLTPDLTVRIAGDYSHVGGKGVGASYANRLVLDPVTRTYIEIPSGLDRSVGLLDPQSQAYRTRFLYSATSGRYLAPLFSDTAGPGSGLFLDNNYYGLNGEVIWKTAIGTVTIVPGYRANDLRNTYDATGSNQYVQEQDHQYSLEARLAGNRIGFLDYIVGVYFFKESVDGNYTFDQGGFSSLQDFTTSTKSYAGFTRLTANVTDRLRIVGGIRYTRDIKRLDGGSDGITVVCRNPATPIPACPNATFIPLTDTVAEIPFAVPASGAGPVPHDGGSVISRGPVTINQTLREGKATYRGAIEYDLGPRSLLYTSYETGYRSGGFALSFGHETFEPEFITAYTIGSKNRFFDNRLQLNIEAFYWKYTNQQVTHSGVDIRGQNSVFTENVGRSTNKGVEVELQALATKHTLLTADVQYLNARFNSFNFVVPSAATPPLTGCPFAVNPAVPSQVIVNCSGRPGYNSPQWTLNLGAQQTVPLGHYRVVGSVNTQYKGRRVAGFDYLPFQFVSPTWSTNINLTFGPPDERWSIGAFVRNLENERVIASPYILTTGAAGLYVSGPPRTYGLRGAIKF